MAKTGKGYRKGSMKRTERRQDKKEFNGSKRFRQYSNHRGV